MTLLICSSVTLDANTIIGTTTSIFPVNPGVINANGKTLTINGPVVGSPMHQWLSGFAAGEVMGLRIAYPLWTGAVGDNSTDCTTALKVAYASVASATATACGKLVISKGVYRFTFQLVWE